MQAMLSRIVEASADDKRSARAPANAPDIPGACHGGSPPISTTTESFLKPQEQPTSSPTVSADAKREIALAVERLQYATLLSERKAAVSALQTLARSYSPRASTGGDGSAPSSSMELTLGAAAAPAVLTALVSDPRDTELMEALLEFLQALVVRAPPTASLLLEEPQQQQGQTFGTSSTWGMQTCLSLLQDPSPWIRGPAIALVRVLQEAQPRAFAHAVCECKEGLRRLLEVVEDKREHIRDAALQVLGQLTGRDKNAQQFLAFEDGFARLFQIMELEGVDVGGLENSTVVSDCLQIVNNMVRDNLMTQKLLLDMPYLESHVPTLLRLPALEDDDKLQQPALTSRKRVLKLGLQLVRFLVARLYEGARESALNEMALRDRDRKAQELASIQSLVARQEALMGAVGEIACYTSDAFADLRLQALDLLRIMTEHNGGVQMILVNLYARPSGCNVLSELVKLDVGKASDDSPVSAAASALLDTLFSENEGARMALLQHIHAPPPLPDDTDGTGNGGELQSAPPSAGRVLLDAYILNAEAIARHDEGAVDREVLASKLVVAWKAGHRLVDLLSESKYCKELALRVPSQYDDPGARAVGGGLFLSRCLRLLRPMTSTPARSGGIMSSMVFQVKLAVLVLLIYWCHNCPKAVREIVGSVTNLSILVDNLSAVERDTSMSKRAWSESTQLRGLCALLLGCCLEFLGEDDEEKALKMATVVSVAASGGPMLAKEQDVQMTRGQLLDMVSKRVGLERFTDALVKFQQNPAVVACAQVNKTQSSRTVLAYRATYDVDDDDLGAEDATPGAEAHYLFMLYERAFTALYRELAESVQKRAIAIYTGGDHSSSGQEEGGGASDAMGAYQDLIRIQDKQIHELQEELVQLKQEQTLKHGDCSPNVLREEDLHRSLAAQGEQLECEKAELAAKIKSMAGTAREMEARVDGLSLAYEQLEREHASCSSGSDYQREDLSTFQDERVAVLEAQLDAERDVSKQLRREVDALKGVTETQAVYQQNDLELANARFQMELEELRAEAERKEEQFMEYQEMLDTLSVGQTLLKNENEKLKEQLTARGLEEDIAVESVAVQHLREENERVELRVAELEADARATFERDQEVLQQRIEEVEQARQASPPCSPAGFIQQEAATPQNTPELRSERLREMLMGQLKEIQALRKLVLEMEAMDLQREEQVKQVGFLQDLVAGYDMQSRRDKQKADATIRELEDELARTFLEKKDADRKTKTSVKELENEVARLFLVKVELEKQISGQQRPTSKSEVYDNEHEALLRNGDRRGYQGSSPIVASDDSEDDDIFVLVASLEIQCAVLRDSLKQAKGAHAVDVALELSRQRGAVVAV